MDGRMDGGRDGCIVADKRNDFHPQLNKSRDSNNSLDYSIFTPTLTLLLIGLFHFHPLDGWGRSHVRRLFRRIRIDHLAISGSPKTKPRKAREGKKKKKREKQKLLASVAIHQPLPLCIAPEATTNCCLQIKKEIQKLDASPVDQFLR